MPEIPHAHCVRCTTRGCRCSGSPSVAHRRRLACLKSLHPSASWPASESQITVQLAGRLDRPLRVNATARATTGETQVASGEPDGEGRAIDRARREPQRCRSPRCRRQESDIRADARRIARRRRHRRGAACSNPVRAGFEWLACAQLARRRLDAERGSRFTARRPRRRVERLPGRCARRCRDLRCEPAILEFAGVRRAEPRPRINGAGRRAVICPRRISAIGARVGSACIVGTGGARSAREHRVRRRQVGQHGPRPGCESLPACPTRGAGDRERPHRARFAGPGGFRRGSARVDSAWPCSSRNVGAGAGLADEPERRNQACTRARRCDRRARALRCRTAHADRRHRRFRRRCTTRRVARAARSFPNRADRAGRRARRRRQRARTCRWRGRRRCASRGRSRGIAGRHALGARAPPAARRARHDRRCAA